MASAYKVLGQINPAATTLSTIYTVPASTQAVVSTLSICNLGTAAATFRVAVRPAGASITNAHYIAYDAVVSAYDSVYLTLGISLAATDVVSVYASNALVAFSLFGAEIT